MIHDEADARAWIDRLRALPAYYEQQIANLRRGIATGFVQPRRTAESVLSILSIAADQPAEQSPLLSPLAAMPATIAPQRQAALRAQALEVIADTVKPAQHNLASFFATVYVPHARTELGASTRPEGRAYYEFAVRRSTTTALSPDQVFALGTREIERLRREMETAMRATGFSGTLKEFIAKIRTEPQFYAPDIQTYLEKAAEIGKRIDALLPRWFATLPRLTWGSGSSRLSLTRPRAATTSATRPKAWRAWSS